MSTPRVLIAKIGLDGHDRGAKVIASALSNAGFEVIYSGLHQTVQGVVRVAIQEDVSCIGISAMSAAHMTIFPLVLAELKLQEAQHIFVFGGGVITEGDALKLKNLGVDAIFTPGTTTQSIISWLNQRVKTLNNL
jgi:methylmalonyl-CoA mutase C-terminal domain/subunit